ARDERTGRVGEHRPNSLDEPLPVAQRYPELFEIVFCQLRQHIAVDRVLDECRLVSAQAQVSQPATNIHNGALIRSRLIIILLTNRVQHIRAEVDPVPSAVAPPANAPARTRPPNGTILLSMSWPMSARPSHGMPDLRHQ